MKASRNSGSVVASAAVGDLQRDVVEAEPEALEERRRGNLVERPRRAQRIVGRRGGERLRAPVDPEEEEPLLAPRHHRLGRAAHQHGDVVGRGARHGRRVALDDAEDGDRGAGEVGVDPDVAGRERDGEMLRRRRGGEKEERRQRRAEPPHSGLPGKRGERERLFRRRHQAERGSGSRPRARGARAAPGAGRRGCSGRCARRTGRR